MYMYISLILPHCIELPITIHANTGVVLTTLKIDFLTFKAPQPIDSYVLYSVMILINLVLPPN